LVSQQVWRLECKRWITLEPIELIVLLIVLNHFVWRDEPWKGWSVTEKSGDRVTRIERKWKTWNLTWCWVKLNALQKKWRNLDSEVHNAFLARLTKIEMKKCVAFCYMWITEESQRITVFCHVGLSCADSAEARGGSSVPSPWPLPWDSTLRLLAFLFPFRLARLCLCACSLARHVRSSSCSQPNKGDGDGVVRMHESLEVRRLPGSPWSFLSITLCVDLRQPFKISCWQFAVRFKAMPDNTRTHAFPCLVA
jgi:hypothetical protein